MPALNEYSDELVALPDCTTVPLPWGVGLISYHRTWAPAPPSTAWATHTVVALATGSKPETAWVIRPSSVSSVSSVFTEFFWGAFAGFVYDPTVMESGAEICGTLGFEPFGVSVNTVSFVPVPQFGGHSMSDIDMM